MENVVLQPTAIGDAITCKGDATITLTGSNSLTAKSNYSPDVSTSGSGIYVESGTLTIDGEGSLYISRTYVNNRFMSIGAGIGAGDGANIVIKRGNISIDSSSSTGFESGAGIGGLDGEQCGNITITGGTISIGEPYSYAACIGSVSTGNCGNITISGESTVITYTKGRYANGIGSSIIGECGTVTIGDGVTINNTKYTDTQTGPL